MPAPEHASPGACDRDRANGGPKLDDQQATFVVSTRRDRLEELASLIAAGEVEVAIAQTFPLSAGRDAYESGSLPKPRPGKTVILVS